MQVDADKDDEIPIDRMPAFAVEDATVATATNPTTSSSKNNKKKNKKKNKAVAKAAANAPSPVPNDPRTPPGVHDARTTTTPGTAKARAGYFERQAKAKPEGEPVRTGLKFGEGPNGAK